jgi:hypothetical protein
MALRYVLLIYVLLIACAFDLFTGTGYFSFPADRLRTGRV